MIQAVLNGKSKGYEYTEDILTSVIFGSLKYLKPEAALIPFIESAVIYDIKNTPLWDRLSSKGIELRCYREVNYVFWTSHPTKGEPDLILVFRNHVHGAEDFLLVIENKFKSSKSGINENDQLVRYYEAIDDENINDFYDPIVSGFRGIKGYIIYLTEARAYSDIIASIKLLSEKNKDASEYLFHLRWHQLYKTFEVMYSVYSTYEKQLVDELMAYMDKIGLRDFSGISLPDAYLISAFTLPYPIFFHDKPLFKEKGIYFSNLNHFEFKHNENIFFRG